MNTEPYTEETLEAAHFRNGHRWIVDPQTNRISERQSPGVYADVGTITWDEGYRMTCELPPGMVAVE